MSYLEMLKAAMEATKETKKDSSSSPTAEAAPTKKDEVTKEAPAWRSTYAHPWPDAISGLGRRTIGRFDPCVSCGRGSWVRYGGVVLCCPCAMARPDDERSP